MDKHILISGITGFVGQNLKAYLEPNDHKILGLGREIREGVEKTYADEDLFKDITHFIHLAGKAHDLKKVADDSVYYEVNKELTKKLFDTFLASDCQTFVFVSSVKAAADQVEGVLDEQYIANPQTVYGKSKLAAEQYLLSKCPADKTLVILRPCMIHGPFNKGNLNLLYQVVKKGVPYPLGAFENKRSFLSVENLCYVLEQIIKKPISSGIYHVADDESISTNTLIQIIAASLEKRPRILKINKNIIQSLAKIGDVLSLPLDSEKLQKLTESYQVSNRKLVKAIGNPLPIKTKEGLIKTIQSF